MRQSIAEELHRQVRRNFLRRRVELTGIDDLYQSDLVEMGSYSRLNNGYKYILTVINCFSKFAYAVPLKKKLAVTVTTGLSTVLQSLKTPPKHFQTDQGTEFYNASVQKLLQKYGINHYSCFSDKKASIVERFNKTLKQKMWREFTAQGTYEWLDLLPKLVAEYNDTVHRTIGMKPNQVNKKNEDMVLRNINKATYYRRGVKLKAKYKVGDRVRISKYKKQFAKGYIPNWSNEIFTVFQVRPTRPITYKLKDDRGEIIQGSFYEPELNKSKIGELYVVEKVIRRKGNKVYVRWLGFDASHDSWVNKKYLL